MLHPLYPSTCTTLKVLYPLSFIYLHLSQITPSSITIHLHAYFFLHLDQNPPPLINPLSMILCAMYPPLTGSPLLPFPSLFPHHHLLLRLLPFFPLHASSSCDEDGSCFSHNTIPYPTTHLVTHPALLQLEFDFCPTTSRLIVKLPHPYLTYLKNSLFS